MDSGAMLNLTQAMQRACDELNATRQFNGRQVMEARCESEEQRRADLKNDGFSDADIEENIHEYACVHLSIDNGLSGSSDCPSYEERTFQHDQLQADFRAWLLTFVDGDEDVLPDEIDLNGANEIYRRERVPAAEQTSESPVPHRHDPDFDALTTWISGVPNTWLPGLLRHVVTVGTASGVFMDGGAVRIVQDAVASTSHAERPEEQYGQSLAGGG